MVWRADRSHWGEVQYTWTICLNHFLHYSIVQPQSFTPYFYKTKEYIIWAFQSCLLISR